MINTYMVVGFNNGQVMALNLRNPVAPSISAASNTSFEMPFNPAI